MLLSPFLSQNVYFFLVPAAFVEGPLIAILCGVAVNFGYLDPAPAFVILIAGDLVPDMFYYTVGRWAATLPRVRRFATRTRLIREHLPEIEELWRTSPFKAMFTAKMTFTLAPPFLVSAGLSAMPFLSFVRASLSFSLPFFGLLFGFGYAIGAAFGYAPGFLNNAPIFFAIIGAIILATLIFVGRLARDQFSHHKAEEHSNVIET